MSSEQTFLRSKILLCLFLVCISWGSSYLFIELGLRSFPPFLLTGLRLLLAGAILFPLLRLFGQKAIPAAADIRRAFIVGFFMSVLSAGLMTVGQKYVPSGTVAIIMGSMPLWMIFSGWLFLHEKRPSRRQFFGLALGSAGIVILGTHQGSLGTGSAFGMLCLALNIAGWVGGSIYTKLHAHDTKLSVLQSTALMLMAGGLELLLVSLLAGESVRFSAIPALGWASLSFLVVFAGITAYTCYFWLLEHTTTAVTISFEYANPAIGMLLGWLVTGETIDAVKVGACITTALSLYFVVSGSRQQ